MLLCDTDSLVGLGLGYEAAGDFYLVLTVGRVRALFKLVGPVHLEPVLVGWRSVSQVIAPLVQAAHLLRRPG